jgi:putative transposase
MNLTAQIKLLPAKEQETLLQSTMEEYISSINDLVDYFLGQGKMPKMSTKDFNASLPSALKNQVLKDAKSVYRKCRKTKRQHILKKKAVIWNNQNYRIEKDKLVFPVWQNKSIRLSVKADIPDDLLDILQTSKLGTLRITKKGNKYIAQIAYEKPELITVIEPKTMGIDLGIKCPAVAVTSEGNIKFFGNGREAKFIRRRYKTRRKKLQKAKKLKAVRKLSNKEHCWMKNKDHEISRQIVNYAFKNHIGTIKLESLSGIRSNVIIKEAQAVQENVFDYIESKAQTKGERVSEASRNFVNDCLNFVKEFVEKEREQ